MLTQLGHASSRLKNELATIDITGPHYLVRRLESYFHPWLSSTESRGVADVNVSIVQQDATQWATENRLVGVPHETLARIRNENASRDYMVERLTVAGRSVYRFPETGTYVTREGSQISVIGSSEAFFWDAKELIQSHVLRPLMLRSSAMLHSATVVIDGEAWVICGDKGAGKTTLQHHLATAGARFMSTDRTYLHNGPGGTRAIGHPGRMRIVVDDLSRGPLAALTSPRLMEGTRKAIVPVADVAGLLGTGIEASAPVRAIIVLTREPNEALVMRNIAWQDEVLRPHWLDVSDPMVSEWLMPGDRRIGHDARQGLVDNSILLVLDSSPLLALSPTAAVETLHRLTGRG